MKTRQPLVSVLMVAFNSSRYIREAIQYALCQTYQHFELIIIDDHSTDDTWQIVATYNDDRIKKVRNEKNLGEYANRNLALGLAQGEYLVFIDADDIIYPHGIEFMMRYALQFEECAMVVSRPWDERVIYPAKLSPQMLYRFEYLDKGAIGINFTKVLFKRSTIESFTFPKRVRLGDVYMQYYISRKYCTVLIPDASTWWRRTKGQASENLLAKYDEYLRHDLWIKLEMLDHADCPLSAQERQIARYNLYGNYARYLVKRLLKFKFKTVMQLLRQYPIPASILFSVFTRQNRHFFDSYSGDNPFR